MKISEYRQMMAYLTRQYQDKVKFASDIAIVETRQLDAELFNNLTESTIGGGRSWI